VDGAAPGTGGDDLAASILAATGEAVVAARAVRGAGGAITDFRWAFANPAATRLLDAPAAALVGHRLSEVSPQLLTEDLLEAYARVVEDRQPRGLLYRQHGDDPEATLAIALSPLDDGFVATLADRSAEHRRLHDLASSEARFREAVEHNQAFVCHFLPDLTVTYVNRSFARRRGMSKEEMLGTLGARHGPR
jgi:PAS domain-containing protein